VRRAKEREKEKRGEEWNGHSSIYPFYLNLF
jgi:hypothetical protein